MNARRRAATTRSHTAPRTRRTPVMGIPGNAVPRFLSVDTIFPPILAVLEEQM